jgi:hypothetical protein
MSEMKRTIDVLERKLQMERDRYSDLQLATGCFDNDLASPPMPERIDTVLVEALKRRFGLK